jgi:hypothetical protein
LSGIERTSEPFILWRLIREANHRYTL